MIIKNFSQFPILLN